MTADLNLTDSEILELSAYAEKSVPGEERTRKVARLGRCLLYPMVAIPHGEDYADALPDEFWELAYDRYANAMDETVIHGTYGAAPRGILERLQPNAKDGDN